MRCMRSVGVLPGVAAGLEGAAASATAASALVGALTDSCEMVRANAALACARWTGQLGHSTTAVSAEAALLRLSQTAAVDPMAEDTAVEVGSGTGGRRMTTILYETRVPVGTMTYRYTRYYAMEALRRLLLVRTGGAGAEFVALLMQQFWCPDTSRALPF